MATFLCLLGGNCNTIDWCQLAIDYNIGPYPVDGDFCCDEVIGGYMTGCLVTVQPAAASASQYPNMAANLVTPDTHIYVSSDDQNFQVLDDISYFGIWSVSYKWRCSDGFGWMYCTADNAINLEIAYPCRDAEIAAWIGDFAQTFDSSNFIRGTRDNIINSQS